MSELWYWRSNDRVRGPLVTEELEAIVLRNRLSDGDAVRLDGSEEWICASDIRRMFLQSSEVSPAETAAKLLQTAASRRLQSRTLAPQATVFGGAFGRLTGATGELAGSLFEFAVRSFEAGTSWLGRRGRLLVTAVAGVAIVVFLGSRLISWSPSDVTRLHQIQAIWKQALPDQASGVTLSTDAKLQLETHQSDLEGSLRAQPVSGTSGSSRTSALARREMLFAVREIRQAADSQEEAARGRIEESLETASDYLTGASPSREVPGVVVSRPEARRSIEIIAIIVLDTILIGAFAAWWIIGRGRG